MAVGIGSLVDQLTIFALLLLCINVTPTAAFGAGNIASISKIEGTRWRHGDIEDMLKTIAFIKGHKWTSMMVKRVYFGNWLRDYSQAMDVGSLKGIQAGTIRILVWILSFMSFGYATAEFEVTEERLGVYRPEEHIDNPKHYADDLDARKYDPRLRPPVEPVELEIDPRTGMKNYIANEAIGIATSMGYVKFSLTRSIHFGRVYTNGSAGTKAKEADLYEALRCLGQALHCLEDFGAHTNYTELALREMGYRDVFPHTGSSTEINIQGQRIFPLVTGTFGVVDFIHSVLGEANDHFAQTEVEQVDLALKEAEAQNRASGDGTRGISGSGQLTSMTEMLSSIPGAGDLAKQAQNLQMQSNAQERKAESEAAGPGSNIPGTNIDPMKTAAQIYPILEFRDRVVKMISATIEKIPGLEALVEKITETLTLFILSLLAPFIRPVIDAVSKQLKAGSGGVVDASGKHQYEPWTDPHCSDPTHSLLSKDHFSNILNEPAGKVASTILQYVAPRVLYAWQHPDIPVEQVLNDVTRVFHHPALRDHQCELHRNMFSTVESWVRSRPDGGSNLNILLSSESVRHGRNHIIEESQASHSHGGLPSSIGNLFSSGSQSQSKTIGGPWEQIGKMREFSDVENAAGGNVTANEVSAQMAAARPTHDDVRLTPSPRPAASPAFGYSNPDLQQDPQYQSYGQPSYPSDPSQQQPPYGSAAPGQYPYQAPPPFDPGYGGYNGYAPQPPFPAYGGAPPYGFDPNGPPPAMQYGQNNYGAPPPAPYYGGQP